MRRLRWAVDGGGVWELDAESAVTMEGTARAVPGDPLPLGLSRGARITRAKQLDFMHRFIASPLVPSLAADPANGGRGVLLHHAHTLHLRENWSASILGQFNVKKIISLFRENASSHLKETLQPKNIMKHMLDVCSFGFGTEYLITPDSSVLFETYDVSKGNRGKAVFYHKLQKHNLTMEAAWPGLFVDKSGTYWDVPLAMAVDLASISSASGLSYHLCLQHNSGQPKHFGGDQNTDIPMSLLPGLCAKTAISVKKNVNFWRKKEGKIRMVQPYDAFLSEPHISGSGIIGTVLSASIGDNSARLSVLDERQGNRWRLCAKKNNFALSADLFASVSLTAQHGNFQRLFLDLTRLNARFDFPSGSTFLSGAARLAHDVYHSRQPDSEAIHAVCPDLTLSLQQQIVGPISLRADSRIVLDSKDGRPIPRIDEPILAVDWALKVLGSARATAWFSPKNREAMVELRFFES